MRGFSAPSTGPNINLLDHATLVNRSRHISRNDPWGATMKERKVTNMIGTGIKPRSMVKDREIRERIHALWNLWIKQSDYDGVLNFYGQQELLAGEWYDAGECFGRKRVLRNYQRGTVPLRIQLIEAEQVPVTHNISPANGNYVHAGIERNADNQRVAYHMYRSHPGEMHLPQANGNEIIRVPAAEVIHTYQPMRAGQLRGQPTITPIIQKLYQVTQFDDATLVRQWVSTLFAGILKRPTAAKTAINPLTGQTSEQDEDGFDIADVEAGTMQELPPGWDMQWNTPPDAGSSYGEFMRQQLMSSAAAIGMSYEILTGDLRGINDRLLRALLQEFRRRIRMSQQLIISHQFCQNVWETWMDLAVLSGAIDLPNYETLRDQYQAVRWVPEKWQYLNPVQDVQAEKDEVRNGFTTRAEIVSQKGGDIEEIDIENAADQQRTDELGLVYDSDARNTSSAGLTQGRPAGIKLPWDEDDEPEAPRQNRSA